MLLLLCVLSLSAIVIYYYSEFKSIKQEIKSRNAAVSHGDCSLEAANVMLNKCTWIPVFIKVYLIGILETLYIAICKRGLFKDTPTQSDNESQVDTLIQNNTTDKQNIAVITGGDSGIGYEICKGLLAANYHVIIGTRFVTTCEPIVNELKTVTGSDKLSCIEVDLASFKSVHVFAEKVKKQIGTRKIHLLINNAGIMNIPFTMTEDGYEAQSQTNYLSPFLLTQLLLPVVDIESGRILFASSSTMYATQKIDTNKSKETYTLNGLDHYAFSKSCIMYLAQKLAKSTPIQVYCYHPGTVRTKLFAHTTVFSLPLVSKLFDFIMLSPKEGARTPLYLCLTKELKSGGYWANERPQTIPHTCINGKEDDIQSLWQDTLMKINT